MLVRRLLDAVNNTVKTKETNEGSAVDHQETTVVYQETPHETLPHAGEPQRSNGEENGRHKEALEEANIRTHYSNRREGNLPVSTNDSNEVRLNNQRSLLECLNYLKT